MIALRSIWEIGLKKGTPTTQLRKEIKAELKWGSRTQEESRGPWEYWAGIERPISALQAVTA